MTLPFDGSTVQPLEELMFRCSVCAWPTFHFMECNGCAALVCDEFMCERVYRSQIGRDHHNNEVPA